MESPSHPTPPTLVATATAYMRVFTTLDPNTIISVLSEDYKHVFAPASLNPPGPFTRDGFFSHLTQLQGILRSFPVQFKQTWPNPSLNQIVIWADSETEFHDHVKDNDDVEEWKFRGEYLWVLTMNLTGEKVEHVLEFLDSKATEQLRGLMARAFKKLAESDGKDGGNVEGGRKYQ
ncbi:hypothetical protein BJ170DRAFT_617053 [Xylariales sp. AK1849]|nr:hypothetical protein BJ170DRAFT_617053 [Xylariales sp. AK1849]